MPITTGTPPAASPLAPPTQGSGRPKHRVRLGHRHLRRYPVTLTGLVVLVVVGLSSGAVTAPVADHPWAAEVSYGLGPLSTGHVATVITGAGLAATPILYLAVLGSFAGFVGLAERLLGSTRAALLWVTGHLVAVLGGIGLVGLLGSGPVRDAVDVGPSGGALFAGLVAAGGLPRGWRRLVQWGLTTYAVGSFLLLSGLPEVIHLVAVAAGWLVVTFSGRRAPRATTDPAPARAALRRHGGSTMSWMTTWRGLRYFHAPAGDGYVAYRAHAGVAIALGEPVGTREFRLRAPQLFAEHCRRHRLRPAWFAVGQEYADRLVTTSGARTLQVAEEGLLDLPSLAFRGKKWQDVRTARNRAAREGIDFALVRLTDVDPATLDQVRAVSRGWVRSKHTPELGFTLGSVEQALDPEVRTGLATDADGVVHGVTTWLPVHGADGAIRGWTLDVMRRRVDGFGPVVEFSIAEACLRFQEEGYEVASLSGAPMAHSGDRAPTGRWSVQRSVEAGARLLEPVYGFGSLHAFKRKFQPTTHPLHLAYGKRRHLPRIGLAVLLAFLRPGATPRPAVEAPAPLPVREHGVGGPDRTDLLVGRADDRPGVRLALVGPEGHRPLGLRGDRQRRVHPQVGGDRRAVGDVQAGVAVDPLPGVDHAVGR